MARHGVSPGSAGTLEDRACELCGWAGAPFLRCVAFLGDQDEPRKVPTER